ncbi:MAG TPA: SwmB domain-containing protein, partial [Syntrophomonadaceae bacterium]|nr:SwmB domain-containing protein [Syntrophomonadaceae bacterium]
MRVRMNPDNKYAAALIMLLCMTISFASPAFAAAEGTSPVAISGAVTDKGDISILFDQAIADPAGTQGQFTVMADEIEVAVNSVGTTNTMGKIKLDLETDATAAQKVVVTYTKSEDTV